MLPSTSKLDFSRLRPGSIYTLPKERGETANKLRVVGSLPHRSTLERRYALLTFHPNKRAGDAVHAYVGEAKDDFGTVDPAREGFLTARQRTQVVRVATRTADLFEQLATGIGRAP